MLTEKQKDNFFKAVDSLKKYRRADLQDERGKNLIKDLYVDVMPNDQILKNCLADNTTFLIGRKGTGKSTIFLRLEQEYISRSQYISCYIDTKTLFEASQSDNIPSEYLNGKLPPEILSQYFIQRAFIQNVLMEIISVVDMKYKSTYERIKRMLGIDKTEEVKNKLSEVLGKVKDNEMLQKVEIPVITETSSRIRGTLNSSYTELSEGKIGVSSCSPLDISLAHKMGNENKSSKEWEDEFSKIFIKIFQIKNIISQIKHILSLLGVKHLIVMLDDFSEINELAIKTFVDTVLAPLNNWSDEFIKFKVAAYPNRVHYGDIDKGKIDTIDLDFYNLYSVDRGSMEERAIDFTQRIISSRINYFCKESESVYFDTRSENFNDYCELLFQTSMNIPRILGYILYYCYQTNIVYGNQINRKAIETAAQTYYEKNIFSFFEKSTYSLMSYDNKVSILQQKELIELYVSKMKDIKKRIISGELTSEIYNKTQPYASHFNITPSLEQFLSTLELNFFLTKYGEMSDRDGRKVSIYAINYGLAVKHNLKWGKQKGNDYRKYFIARPFDFSKDTEEFLRNAKKIMCINPACAKTYPYEQLDFLKFNKMRCVECQSPVEIVSVSENIRAELTLLDEAKLLPNVEYSILYELNKHNNSLYARDIAEELDVSSKLIGKRAKKLDEEKGYIARIKKKNLMTYKITEKARKIYFGKDE